MDTFGALWSATRLDKRDATADLRNYDLFRINQLNIRGILIYIGILYIVVFLDYVSGKWDWLSLIGFAAITALGIGGALIRYRRDRSDRIIKYWLASVLLLMYLYVMILGTSELRFAFIFPTLCMMVLYHKVSYMLIVSAVILLINVCSVIFLYFFMGQNHEESVIRYTIQLLVVIFTTLGATWTTKIFSDFYDKNMEQTEELHLITLQTIETIANTIDAKDSYTQGHSRRVAEYSVKIAEYMNIDSKSRDTISYIALLHDVGKIAVPDTVLNKPSKLTDEEYDLIKGHVSAGGDILKDITLLQGIALGAKYHHERYDGTGYPDGLKGEEIPIIARIIGLADAYDAMTSNRVYRRHLQPETVMEEIKKCSGTQFDPVCVDAFIKYMEESGARDLINRYASEDKDVAAMKKKDDETGARFDKIVKMTGLSEDEARVSLDVLTGVLNRTMGEKIMSSVLINSTGAIVMINIMGLKEINLQFGYRRGDYYLKLVASTLMDLGDNIMVARFDGNDFLCFVRDIIDRGEISEWINTFIKKLNAAQEADPLIEDMLRVSCAITIHDDTSTALPVHIRELDKVMYHLKTSGTSELAFFETTKKEGDELAIGRDIEDLVRLVNQDKDYIYSHMPEDDEASRALCMLKETGGKGALLLLTAKPVNGDKMPVENREHVMKVLEEAIVKVVKNREKIICYSSLQRLVAINVNDRRENIEELAMTLQKEILKLFYKQYSNTDVELFTSHSIVDENGELS